MLDADADSAFKKLINDMFHFLCKHKHGDFISWELIESAVGYERGPLFYTALYRARRRFLKDRKIVTYPKREKGLRLLSHSQAAVEAPEVRQKRAYRQLTRGIREAETVDLSKLSSFQRMQLGVQIKRMREERRAIYRTRKTGRQSFVLKPVPSLPRRPVPM